MTLADMTMIRRSGVRNTENVFVQVCDMHARLKKLEREADNIEMGQLRGRVEGSAPICGRPMYEQGFHGADSACAINGAKGHPEQPFWHEVCTANDVALANQ